MSWRVLAVVGWLAIAVPAGAQEESIGTIGFGTETFEIVHAAAYQGPMPGTVDLEFFDAKLPAGETYFSLDSEATAALRGMRLRISAEPAYRNGTWMHPSIEGHDAFYYFDAEDPIVLTYESGKERIRGSIVGEDRIGSTSTKVNLTFDLPIAVPRE
jgi:hypothetical protein